MAYTSTTVIRTEKETDNPKDSVQIIIWDYNDRNSRTFLTGGWDGIARLYEI